MPAVAKAPIPLVGVPVRRDDGFSGRDAFRKTASVYCGDRCRCAIPAGTEYGEPGENLVFAANVLLHRGIAETASDGHVLVKWIDPCRVKAIRTTTIASIGAGDTARQADLLGAAGHDVI